MLMRRLRSSSRRTSPLAPWATHGRRSATGTMTWFETMVESAIEATMTIEVAAEKPPRKVSSAISGRFAHIGKVSMNMSGFAPAGSQASPPMAIGSTNSVIRNRYSGNNHEAVRRWRSSLISTTVTWNWRGRQTIAAAERKVSVIQRGPSTCSERSRSGGMRAKISAGPPAMPNTTSRPTPSIAASLTTASTAIAATTPWWRSLASMLRVPKRIVNTAIPAATQKASDEPACAS